MRLIDADDYDFMQSVTTSADTYIAVRQILATAPTVDAAPVVHGKWISIPYKLARVCSRCESDEPYKFAQDDADVFYYCPNCGAKMDGGKDG